MTDQEKIDALVAALESALEYYEKLGVTQPWFEQARAALRLAKGET